MSTQVFGRKQICCVWNNGNKRETLLLCIWDQATVNGIIRGLRFYQDIYKYSWCLLHTFQSQPPTKQKVNISSLRISANMSVYSKNICLLNFSKMKLSFLRWMKMFKIQQLCVEFVNAACCTCDFQTNNCAATGACWPSLIEKHRTTAQSGWLPSSIHSHILW